MALSRLVSAALAPDAVLMSADAPLSADRSLNVTVMVSPLAVPTWKAMPEAEFLALGPHGVAIMDFCKEYNARTEAQRGTIVPVEISIYEDRT